METTLRAAETPLLNIAYEQTGPDSGDAILLLHGFPYDVRQYDEMRDILADPERRIIVPYLRGYGPTHYRTAQSFRSGQQAALGKDVIDLLDALRIPKATLVGFDWGGRAACVAAALFPDRVRGLVSAGGYSVEDIAKAASSSQPPKKVYASWYQSYFNTKQGEIGLQQSRSEFCKFLWKLWSPTWRFTDDEYAETAKSFQNPDFVATVLHSYRHRYGNAPGDPALEPLEALLAKQPPISVPTISLHGVDDQVAPPESTEGQEQHFTGPYRRLLIPNVGHCVPAEAASEMSGAVVSLLEAPEGDRRS